MFTFPRPYRPSVWRSGHESQREEINLNYVAVTRTKLPIARHNTVIGMMRDPVSKANSATTE